MRASFIGSAEENRERNNQGIELEGRRELTRRVGLSAHGVAERLRAGRLGQRVEPGAGRAAVDLWLVLQVDLLHAVARDAEREGARVVVLSELCFRLVAAGGGGLTCTLARREELLRRARKRSP